MFTMFILIAAGVFGASILTHAQISMLDNTFGSDGKAAAIFDGNDDEAFSIAIQPDGKIIEVGWTTNSLSRYAFAVARFSQNGSLDNTFGTNGLVSTFISGGDSTNDRAYSVAIQPDGKIVVAGYSNDTTYSAFAVARFNSNGTLDNTFGTKGSMRTFISGGGVGDLGRSVLIQPNGKIVVVGMSAITISSGGIIFATGFYDLGVARFNSDGKMDNTFGTNGTTSVTAIGDPYDYNSFSCALQPDGKIVVAGSSISFDDVSNVPFKVARLNSNGTLDNTFGVNGTSGTYISGGDSTDDVCNSVSIQPDGKIVMAGYSGRASLTLISDIAFAVARFDSNGTKDSTFGTNGTVRAYIIGSDSISDRAYSAAIQSDGKIVVGGGSSSGLLGQSSFAIARFDSNGTKDSTFGTNGTVTTTFGSDINVSDAAMSIALQTDGKILAGGYSQINATVFVLARYLTSNSTGINEAKSLPKSFALEQNYPNPFNPSTTINYSIPKSGLVTIKVYDILGREVTTLVNEEKNAGNYNVEFNASRLASGIYLYRMSAGSFEETKKLILIK